MVHDLWNRLPRNAPGGDEVVSSPPPSAAAPPCAPEVEGDFLPAFEGLCNYGGNWPQQTNPVFFCESDTQGLGWPEQLFLRLINLRRLNITWVVGL